MTTEQSNILTTFRAGQAVSAERALRTLDGLHDLGGAAGRVGSLYVPALPGRRQRQHDGAGSRRRGRRVD